MGLTIYTKIITRRDSPILYNFGLMIHTEGKFPVGILYNFGDTGGTNVANFYQ
jgi:hypothetical protein